MSVALKVGIDPVKVRRSDAARLMVHHLTLATAYFEACEDTSLQALAEIADAFDADTIGKHCARDWFNTMTRAYEQLDRDAPEVE